MLDAHEIKALAFRKRCTRKLSRSSKLASGIHFSSFVAGIVMGTGRRLELKRISKKINSESMYHSYCVLRQ